MQAAQPRSARDISKFIVSTIYLMEITLIVFLDIFRVIFITQYYIYLHFKFNLGNDGKHVVVPEIRFTSIPTPYDRGSPN